MGYWERDGLKIHFRDEGHGLPFVFQHGLGGDVNQPFGLYRPAAGVRLISFDARGHGETRPLGDVDKLKIATLADDLIGLFDHLEIKQAVVGGISLGAAIAVSVALRYPDRVLGLVLVRPAWIDRPLPGERSPLFDDRSPDSRIRARAGTGTVSHVARVFGDGTRIAGLLPVRSSASLNIRGHRNAWRDWSAWPPIRPCVDRAWYGNLKIPALILGNRQDPIHPWSLAQSLSELIPGALLREVTPKSVGLDRHAADVQQAIDDFLLRHFPVSR